MTTTIFHIADIAFPLSVRSIWSTYRRRLYGTADGDIWPSYPVFCVRIHTESCGSIMTLSRLAASAEPAEQRETCPQKRGGQEKPDEPVASC